MGERLCNGEFSVLPMPLVSSVKDQSKLPKSLLVGGQCLDRVMFCLKPFGLNDFNLKLTKYNSYLCKNLKLSFPRKVNSLPRALDNLVVVNQIVDKNPLRIVAL